MQDNDLLTDLPLEAENIDFTPTRAAGLARLDKFVSRTGRHYASQRNYDFGPKFRSNVSALSPWIRHGLVNEYDVLERVLAKHSLSSAEKFVQEVMWRTYFKGWLEHRPTVWDHYKRDLERLSTNVTDPSYRQAINGETGIECFDHWAHELVHTGYLHNHARMWFASIWVFTLRLPWQLGADFFMQHLLDGDPASNTLSWRWVSGLHTQGKTYLARAENIAKFTNGRFNPIGQLATTAHPLLEEVDHPKISLSHINTPITEPYILLLSEDDTYPNIAPNPVDVVAVNCSALRSPRPLNPVITEFVDAALRQGLDHFQSNDDTLATPNTVVAQLVKSAQTQGVRTIVTPYATTGPVRDVLKDISPMLQDAGLRLQQVQRTYDQLCWAHASKGFFALKKQIPPLLSALKLA